MNAPINADAKLRTEIAACTRLLVMENLMDYSGHVSARVPGEDAYYIQPAADPRSDIAPERMIKVDFEGNFLSSGPRPPFEIPIHGEIYKARPDVNAVVHVHPLPVVLFTICNKPLLPLYGAYDPASARLAIRGIPTYPRSILCDTPERGDELAAAMGSANCCMMRGHGVSTAGANVEEASLTAIQLTNLAEVNYQANLLGDPQPIPEDEQDFVMNIDSTQPQPNPGAPPVGRNAALWKYYCSLAES